MRSNHGFTLLEILVVLLIIGIVSTIGVLSLQINNANSPVVNSLQRLMNVIQLHCNQAELEGSERAISFTEDGYYSLIFKNNEWVFFAPSVLFEFSELAQSVEWQLLIQQEDIELPEEPSDKPHVICFSDGNMSEFELLAKAGPDQQAIALIGGDNELSMRF